MALDSNTAYLAVRCAIDPPAGELETWEACVSVMQVGSALFEAGVRVEGSAGCRIAGKELSIPATGPQHFTDAGNWLTAYYLALICREQGRMTRLSHVPLQLLRDSGAVYDEYIYHWVDALQTYWQEGPNFGDKFTSAFEGTDPARVRVASRELMLKILYPPLNLFYRYFRQDHEGFNAALKQALELHKEYWTADEERATSSAGAIALGPLAMACLAKDAGFPIEVESEYIPKHLVQGTWLGEFPT
ncbi:immunity 49 family protein [Streptomyces sp. 549]|uniref:immunity 49 family protein n=1 Tax=Streptomyces sp. 549 TaxID=3049076 RepID=UPI0024C3AFC6|nr:immunity 49 family protein [Streptomyces sp. 549]